MSLEDLFKSAVRELRQRNVPFAVAGGFAVGLYREQPRLTMDIDLAVLMKAHGAAQAATGVLESLGLRAGIAREADLTGGPLFAIRKRSTKPCMVVGRPAGDPAGEGVDILLPTIPWVADAVGRAQANLVDFGFGRVPALTLEDAVLSKLFALKSARLRAKDLDDLQSIFDAGHDMDTPYLAGQMRRFAITVPRNARDFLPEPILRMSRDVARSMKGNRRDLSRRDR